MNKKDFRNSVSGMARIMTALGLLGAVVTTVLRVWVFPAGRDIDTGVFASNTPVIIMTLLVLMGLAALVFMMRGGPRQEITGKASLTLSVLVLAVGAAFVATGAADIWTALRERKPAEPGTEMLLMMEWLERVFCLLGGAALVRLGLLLASEGASRRGMAQWSLLAPVLWMWFVLANYEMSYASMVRLSDGFFTLGAYVFELLFLFYFARYMAGVGKVGVGTMLLFSGGAAMFAISAPVVKTLLYLQQDSEAYMAAGPTGILDLAIGVLALTVSITLCQSLSVSPAKASEEDAESVNWEAEEISADDLVAGFDESAEETNAE